ncbi:MAG TPA: hypothetical protein DCL61_25825 [Cyanobacteria bacterium UBA12227]|nr:hypothetical protein [Cyanobacteria bacterium UBA12227]HAX89305.1 hypothetical protein [Cyanobacteria bacterium UBA11370]HBY81788.1 hypothetical protein [Cyanobacteria bacterium UBA11148]
MWIKSCPCCGDSLLRHVGRKGIYWFCTSCHQEMIPLTPPGESPTHLTTMNLESMLSSNAARSRTLNSLKR